MSISGHAPSAHTTPGAESFTASFGQNLNNPATPTFTVQPSSVSVPMPNLDLPKSARALVRMEVAKGWHGGPGTYQREVLTSVERKLFVPKEFGLVLYHNRLELTLALDDVDTTIKFDSLTKLSIYSELDFSLAITQEHRNEMITSAYVLTFPSQVQARSWYFALRQVMTNIRVIPESVEVHVPELNTKVVVHIMNDDMDVWQVRQAVLDGLRGEELWLASVERWEKDNSLGVCWKHLDRLEWISNYDTIKFPNNHLDRIISPQLIENISQLQVRTSLHGGHEEREPMPVEGHLLFRGYFQEESNGMLKKLDSGKIKKGRSYYVCTFTNHISFVSGNRLSKKIKGSKLPLESIPFSFIESCDRPGFDSHEGHWIDRSDPNAHSDLELLRHIEGFIDMRELVNIEPSPTSQGNNDPLFDLVLFGKRRIRFEAWGVESRSEWISRLTSLHKHWVERLQKEAEHQVQFARHNDSTLEEDGHPDFQDLESPRNDRMLANPTLWSPCLPNHCYPILKSGVLYIKDRLHQPFRKCHVILTLDGLHFFDHSISTYYCSDSQQPPLDLSRLPPPLKCLHLRDSSGFMPLTNCFVYSRMSLDLAHVDDEVEPHLFPDQLRTTSSNIDRTFSVFQSHIAYLWPITRPTSLAKRSLQFMYRYLLCGHAWYWPWRWAQPHGTGTHHKKIFQARSSQDMDHWVKAIQIATKYLSQNEKWAHPYQQA